MRRDYNWKSLQEKVYEKSDSEMNMNVKLSAPRAASSLVKTKANIL